MYWSKITYHRIVLYTKYMYFREPPTSSTGYIIAITVHGFRRVTSFSDGTSRPFSPWVYAVKGL